MACFTKKELQDQYESLLNEGIDKYEAAQQVLSAEYERISSNANQIRQSIGLAEKKFTPNKINIKDIESKYNTQVEKLKKDFESKKAKTEEPKAGSVVDGDIETNKADIERRKQALRDIMEATGEWMFINGVTDGTFMGEGLLNMNENGDVVLTRFTDSQENLTKGKGVTENLANIAGQFGGEQVATSGIEGGLQAFSNGVVGEYHIPLSELIQLIKDGYIVFAGLGNKEFVLSPHIADKYLTKINGKLINAKYDAELKAVESLLSKEQTPTALSDVESEKKQIEDFGVAKEDVEATHGLLGRVFDGLKKAGLTAAKNVGEWVGIGKGTEKPYSLKIDGKDTQVKNVQPEVVNGFYSPLEKIITESKFDKLPAKQWAEKYANSEEAKWTGLKDWLAKQQGSVSKTDIQQFLKDNRIQVVEVVNSGKSEKYYQLVEEQKNASRELDILESDLDNWSDENYKESRDKKYELNDKIKELSNQIKEEESKTKDTKFKNYQLEGQRENYKEVLVTMPSKKEYANIVKNADGTFTIDFPEGVKYYSTKTFKTETEATKIKDEWNNNNKKYGGQQGVKFKSSHFDEPNILVHLRMNTRTDSEGNKVLFIEEVQSDWGQKGKKEGFKIKPQKSDLEAKWHEPTVPEGHNPKNYSGYWDVYNKKTGELVGRNILPGKNAEQNIEEALRTYDANMQPKAIPSAPFVTDTNAWTKLGLKVALKEAVKQGADKIAWTTGEQQNDRYDLSKQVDEIGWQKNENGTYNITPKKDGSVVGTRDMMANLTLKQVEDYVGKDIAEKIQNDEGKVWEGGNVKQGKLTGQQLKVGGKGMKGFYGSPTEGSLGIVGNVAKSLFKQEPKTIDVFQSDKLASGWSVTTKDINGNVQTNMFDSKSKGLAWLSKQEELEVLSEDAEGKNYTTQHSITITPEMRAEVEGKGQPLFKEAEAQYHIESGKNIIEAIKDFDGSPRATVALTHEIMHPTVVAIIDGAKEGNEVGKKHTETIVSEFNKANPKNKVTVEDLIKSNDAFKDGTTSKQYRQVQEFIAKSWEQYHTEGGKGFSEAFQKVLDQITKVFQSVYKSLTGEQLTPELRKMFDNILGKEELNTNESTPTKEVSSEGNSALRAVESTAKALEGLGKKEFDKFKNEGKEQINNASIDEAREMFGMEQLNSSKITIEDIIKEAHQKHITPSVLDSGSYVRENNIVASVMRGKPLDAAEQYALGNLISKMKKEYRRTEEHIKEAESKKQDSSQLHNKLNQTKEILQNATEALRKAGTIAGRALAIRKEFLDFNMFDEANLISDFKTNMERSNFAMTENDETFISKTANGIFFKQEEVDIQLQKEQEIIQKNKEIAAQNAFAEMNKRKEHIKTSPKLSEALANLDNVLKGKIC